MYKITHNSFLKIGEDGKGMIINKGDFCYSDSELCEIETELNYSLGLRSPRQIGEITEIVKVDGFILTKKP
jgi:hypothetical protein